VTGGGGRDGGGAGGEEGMREGRGALVATLAAELAAELAAPMQGLRDRLALLVDHIDRYVSHSTGPTPYPWLALQGLRHDLGGAYLEATLLVRQLGDVRSVLAPPQDQGAVDCGHEVEVALNLLAMKHASVELIADVSVTPPVRAAAGALALLLTRLLWLCAESVHGVAGSAISLRTWLEPGEDAEDGAEPGDARVVVAIADSGHGVALGEQESATLGRLIEGWHGTLEMVVAPGHGCHFELRFQVAQ
jgi:hypothetical protein